MRSMKQLTTATALLVASSGVAQGAPQKPPEPPTEPPSENEALAIFNGDWTCEGTANLGPDETASFTATIKVKDQLGGFWQRFVYSEKKTEAYLQALNVIGTWGWDARAKKFVRAEFQSNGGYVTGTSTGWKGDVMIWDLEVSNFAGKSKAKHTFTKSGDGEFVHKLDAKLPRRPKPVTVFESTCKKEGKSKYEDWVPKKKTSTG